MLRAGAALAAGNTARGRKPQPPSAYEHYQKLVRDFDALEREMQSNDAEQHELNARLEHVRAQDRDIEAEQLEAKRAHWERERDRQVEVVVEQSAVLLALRVQTDALKAQEQALLTEMEIIHDKQREASETEARRVQRLVHERTSLLEDELTKGKMDLDYITQVVAAKRQQTESTSKPQTVRASSTVQTLVDDVQTRRRREFEDAETAFQARMRDFELEKQELARKAQEIRTTKKRALEILSQNQQQAIKGFFDAPLCGEKPEDELERNGESATEPPSLNFGEILQSLHQSGTQVEHIQSLESERNSAERELVDALQDARNMLEHGPERLEAIEKRLQLRKDEARALGIELEPRKAEYDGAWGVESYAPRQYDLVYFVRGVVFTWVDVAMAEVEGQPATALLKQEVQRWQVTNANMEQERERMGARQLAQSVLENLEIEVVAEMAEDIRLEFEASARRVRDMFTSVFDTVFFTSSSESETLQGKKKAKPQPHTLQTTSPGQPMLRPTLFASSFDHMRVLRNFGGTQVSDSRSISCTTQMILHLRSQPVVTRQRAGILLTEVTVPTDSTGIPSKKTFGFFRSSQQPLEPSLNRKTPQVRATDQQSSPILCESANGSVIPVLTVDTAASLPLSSSPRRLSTTFWENDPDLHVRSITMPSSLGCCSCIQLSLRGDLLACGTTTGELVLWDLLPTQPILLRVWTPAKAQRCRVMRIVFSPDAQRLVAFNTHKVASVFAVNPQLSAPAKSKAKHSDDCFPADLNKFKARNLDLVVEFAAPEALAEPSFTPELCERVPAVVAKASDSNWAAPELRSANFFASFSSLGLVSTAASVLCGASTGDLIKFNLWPQCKTSEGLLGPTHGIQAKFDAPGDAAGVAAPSITTIRREIFRGHRQPVLFASCVQREGDARPTEILSVDQDASICLWEYSATRFAGFGWFEPTQKLRLDLQSPASEFPTAPVPTAPKRQASKRLPSAPKDATDSILKGEMLQIALTPDDARLVFMVFFADPTRKDAGALRFLQIVTASMRLAPVKIQVNFPGGGSATPRFALTVNSLLLLLDNRVHMFALRTGKPIREPIALNQTQGKQQLAFTSIASAVISNHSSTTKSPIRTERRHQGRGSMAVHFAVASDQHSRLLVHSFTTKHSQWPKTKGKRGSEVGHTVGPAH